MAKKRIGILGKGNVGGALARGLKRAGHEVKAVGDDKSEVRETAAWAEVVILAVPFGAIDSAIQAAGAALDGKTLVDVTNALTPAMELAVGFTTSGAEELQRKSPKARVVKAFNTVFAQHMETGRLGDQPLSAFVAGDDERARGRGSASGCSAPEDRVTRRTPWQSRALTRRPVAVNRCCRPSRKEQP